MSTLRFRIQTQALDGGQSNRGSIIIRYNDNSRDHDLELRLDQNFSVTGRFLEVPWLGGGLEEGQNAQQCANYALAFNRDFKNVGAAPSNNPIRPSNLSARVISDNGYPEVEISAGVGTFDDSNCTYTGNILIVGPFVEDNTTQVTPVSLSVVATSSGNCDTIDYTVAASGGTVPYTLRKNGVVQQSSWNGSGITVSMERGQLSQLSVTDSASGSANRTVNAPRKYEEGEINTNITQRQNDADVAIVTTVSISGITPLQYAMTAFDATSGSGYQTSNTFPGVLPGQYKIWVQDKFGCEISRIISISGNVDVGETDTPLYFEFMEGQSLIATEVVDFDEEKGKNYFNTASYNQLADVLHPMRLFFLEKDIVGGQFKSSYTYHYITLHKCNGTKIDIPSIMVQENLGISEKFDCMLFPINGQTGVYFNGGNEYTPDTTTVIGDSPYNKNTPTWNDIGQFVTLSGIGTFEIVSNGYDDDRGGYFVLDTVTASETAATVQAKYNAQDYNLFEFYFSANLIDDKGVIFIEKAFSDDGNVEGNPFVIETIRKRGFNENMLRLEWSDSRNKGGIVFQSGITFKKWCFGEFNPIWSDEAETYKGDQAEYSLKQTSYTDFEILIEAVNQKEITQLNIASGLDGFKCNGLLLVRKKAPEIKRLGKSNLYSWKCEFAYGENNLAVKQDEIVLNVGTGVTGSTGKNSTPNLSGIQLYKDSDGKLITFGNRIAKVGS